MKPQKIAIIGGGGFAKEIIEVVAMLGHQIYGIFADKASNIGYEYKGYLDELLQLRTEFDGVIIAIGVVNKEGLSARKNIIKFLKQHQIQLLSVISPNAIISPSAKIGQGVYIAHQAIISPNAKIANYSMINYQTYIGHDVVIGDNVSIAPQVFIGGGCKIASDVMIGASSSIRQGIEIGQYSTIGMKSLVIKSLKANSFVFSLPSKISINA